MIPSLLKGAYMVFLSDIGSLYMIIIIPFVLICFFMWVGWMSATSSLNRVLKALVPIHKEQKISLKNLITQIDKKKE